jgi:Family of unknown function (DUF5309)
MTATSTDTYDQVGIREDLSDSIWDISPEEVPFCSNAGKSDVDNTYFEWQTDSLAAVSATTAVEGADATFAAASPTTRVGNYTQIIQKTAITSGTLEATDRAGRAKEMAYQVVKRSKEVKRDFEHTICGINNAQAAGNATTARETASVSCWIASNDFGTAGAAGANRGTGGAAATGDGTDAATDGTPRALTEAMLGNVIDTVYTSGGDPNIIMANTFNKRAISQFVGNASDTQLPRTGKKVINAVTVYESDYGVMSVVPNRFLRSRDVLVYDSSFWKIGTLRGMKNVEIAKTGDAEKRQVLMEAGLIANNEASAGIIADLTVA